MNCIADELKAMDRKTRKLITTNGVLHPLADLNRLHVNRGEKGKSWISVVEVVRVEEHSLLGYLRSAEFNSDRVLGVFIKKMRTETDC